MAHGYRGARGGNSGERQSDHDGKHHRRPYVSPYGRGLYGGPGYGAFGWINAGTLDYPDTSSDDSAPGPDQNTGTSGEYDAQPDQGAQSAPLPPYPPPPDLSQPPPAPEHEEAVTIVFKDGRPAEQIHNYILTRSTLIVGDRQRREIPTDQLDLDATAKANLDAGVDFRLPDVPR